MAKITKQNFYGITNPKWWVQQAPGVFQLCYPWATAFGKSNKYYSPGYSVVVVSFRDDGMSQVLEEKNNIELARSLHHKITQEPAHFDSLVAAWKKYRDIVAKDFRRIDEEDITNLASDELWRLYNHLYENYIEELIPSVVIEAFAPYSEQYLIPELTAASPEGMNIQKEITVLTTPLETSFVTSERLSLLDLILQVHTNQDLRAAIEKKQSVKKLHQDYSDFFNQLERHQQQYFWVTNNYLNTRVITVDNLLDGIRQDLAERTKTEAEQEKETLLNNPKKLKQQKAELLTKLSLKPDVQTLVSLLEKLGHWQDQRKGAILQTNHYIVELLKEVSRRTTIPLHLIHYCLPSEIKELLEGSGPGVDMLEDRKKLSVFIAWDRQEEYATGDKAQKIFSLLLDQTVDHEKPLSGIVASTGHATGLVRIIRDPHKDELQPGEILVTSMTRPEFVPLMKKAIAIITDEGGLTSHAAIVSRELGIPCIVGTKVATKVLRNGDRVDVNASNGSITKLSS